MNLMKRVLTAALVVVTLVLSAWCGWLVGKTLRLLFPDTLHKADEQAAARLREVEPMKPLRWIFEGPGGECRMLEFSTFRIDRHVGDSSKGKRVPLSSMDFDLAGEPCKAER